MNAGDAFDSFAAKLAQAHPAFPIVRVFVAPAARDATTALECLVHELAQTAFYLPEASVAATKLQWWRDELARASRGEARHPVTRALGDTARGIDVAAGDALVVATLALREAGPPPDFATQRSLAERIYAPIARLEQSVSGIAEAGATESGAIATLHARALSHLVRELARTPFDDEEMRATLPLNRLARHQLTREALAQPGEARNAAVRDQLADIAQGLAAIDPAGASLVTRVRWRLDRALVAAAGRARDPLPVLWRGLGRAPLSTFWHAWREARRS